MKTESEKMDEARRRYAEMQARIAVYMPRPKVETAIRRGEKHSARTLPVLDTERPRSKGPSDGRR